MKKETLEEAAEHNYPSGDVWTEEQAVIRRLAFKNGAKWQAENMPIHILDVENTYVHIEDGVIIVEKNDKSIISYSEEEVTKLLISCKDRFGGSFLHDYTDDNEVKRWFESYKKK